VILIVVIPNVAFNGQSNKPVKQLGLPRRFVCIRFGTLLLLLEDGLDIITLKISWDMKI
jgi:hypothetical protein